MGLLDAIKSKIRRGEEYTPLNNEPIEPAVTETPLPEPVGLPEIEAPAQEQYPAYQQYPQAQAQAYAPQPQPEIQNMRYLLEVINSKIDTLKANIENLNQTLMVINAKLR